MCAKQAWVEPDAGDPLADQPSVLPCRNSSFAAATAGKEVLTRLLVGGSDVVVDCLTGLLGHLEPDRLASLLLAHRCAIDGMSVRRHIFHLEADNVAASQLAIDGQIEHREVARSSFDLQLAPNRPNVFGSKWRLRPCQFALIPGFAARNLRYRIFRVLHGRAPLLQRMTSLYRHSLAHQKSSGELTPLFRSSGRSSVMSSLAGLTVTGHSQYPRCLQCPAYPIERACPRRTRFGRPQLASAAN